ncbi:hypothetical protein [Rossellomorea yichunensis]|uniref:hypothetical protein n=1 Tax=Rossellomorea yichunensis TaxID=3077331 RepID=UPI0028DF2381|nr:hypothetical protein [Rossellomorea sp. YC4-1]MDT9027461.1 hypothetical protein [Rossellomorea sp. YC4-1]
MNDQLSLFPTVYDCNMRKSVIYKRFTESDHFLTNENLQYIYETISMMMELTCTLRQRLIGL